LQKKTNKVIKIKRVNPFKPKRKTGRDYLFIYYWVIFYPLERDKREKARERVNKTKTPRDLKIKTEGRERIKNDGVRTNNYYNHNN
jgi:hypothetical protein